MKKALVTNTVLVGLFCLTSMLNTGGFSLPVFISGYVLFFLPCLIITTILLGLYKLVSLIWK